MSSGSARGWLILLLLLGSVAHGEEQRKWGLSPFIGAHNPNLEAINKGLFKAPYGGTAQNIDVFGATNSTTFFYQTPLPELSPGTLTGLEFQWNLNNRHALLIGVGTWEASSFATAGGNFPVQGAFESVVSYRKGDLSYNEFYLGWRYNLFDKPKKYKLYTRLTANEVFDVDYREDFSLLFLSGPPKSFRRSSVVVSQGTGLLMVEAGGGGEWMFTNWLSVGMEAGYTVGMKEMTLSDARVSTDFLDTDNLTLNLPIRPNDRTGQMEYLPESGGPRSLRLSFDGWKALLKVTLYY